MEQILVQLRDFAAFYGTKRSLFPDDPVVARSVVTNLVAHHVFFVATVKGELAGFICGFLTPHIFNPSIRILTEALWWVTPEHRGTQVGAKLFAKFIEHGEAYADWISMTLEEKSPVNPATLERRGFKLHERAFLREVH